MAALQEVFAARRPGERSLLTELFRVSLLVQLQMEFKSTIVQIVHCCLVCRCFVRRLVLCTARCNTLYGLLSPLKDTPLKAALRRAGGGLTTGACRRQRRITPRRGLERRVTMLGRCLISWGHQTCWSAQQRSTCTTEKAQGRELNSAGMGSGCQLCSSCQFLRGL